MNRRIVLMVVCLLLSGLTVEASTLKKFAFRIKTKQGNIVGNVLIEAKDVEAAKYKLFKRYHESTNLNVTMR